MKIKSVFLTLIFTFICANFLFAQSLINAVKSGDIGQVKKLLPYDNMEEKDANNLTAYHWTAVMGRTDMAELLLLNGSNPNYLVTDVKAKDLGDGDLLWAGNIIGAPDAAVLAEENGSSYDLIDFYLSKGSIDTHLRTAIMCDNAIVAKRALELGADPDFMVNFAGRRLIVSAAEVALLTGSDRGIDILLKYGADISTAFAHSVIYDRFSEYNEVWEKLLEKGASINPIYEDDRYPQDTLFNIIKRGDKYGNRDSNKFNFLIDHGVNSDKR